MRVENRVLPGGPTVVDILANAAFYYGLIRMLTADERPVWSQMSFSAAEENFHRAAREGIDAQVYWARHRRAARRRAGVAPVVAARPRGARPRRHRSGRPHRLLEIVERRCVTQRNGATWQSATSHHHYEQAQLDRLDALREMTVRYRELMHGNLPVHEWPM